MTGPLTPLRSGLPRGCRGISLIELMVALVIGLVLSGVAVMIYDNNKHAYLVQNNTDQLQENGRFALQLLREDIRMAGYWGLNLQPGTIVDVDSITLSDECVTDWATDFTSHITAANQSSSGTPTGYASCILDTHYKANTDILTVRHASSEAIDTGKIEQNGIYLLTSLMSGSVFKADADAAIDSGVSISETPRGLYRVMAHAYYVRPWSQTAGDGIPSFVREFVANEETSPKCSDEGKTSPCVIEQRLIEYVEDFQLTFGLDTDGNGSVDLYDDNVFDTTKIDQVMTIVVEILVRSPDPEANYSNTRSYTLGDRTYSVNDRIRRQVFRDAIQLRNWPGLGA